MLAPDAATEANFITLGRGAGDEEVGSCEEGTPSALLACLGAHFWGSFLSGVGGQWSWGHGVMGGWDSALVPNFPCLRLQGA